MKKLVTAFAACALAGAVFAQVESVNVVGYMSQTISMKNTMVGLNFGAVGTGLGIAIVDLIPKTQAGLNAGVNAGVSDNIAVLSDSGYTTYFLCNGNIGKGGAYLPAADGWVKFGESAVTTDTIANGGAFWFISQTAETTPLTITLAGQVAGDATQTKEIKTGLNMIANGYAAELAFANPVTGLSVGTKGVNAADSDNVAVLGSAGYTTYFFCNGNIGKGGAYLPAADGWLKFGESTVTTDTVPAGASAWYIARGTNFNWVNSAPYTL